MWREAGGRERERRRCIGGKKLLSKQKVITGAERENIAGDEKEIGEWGQIKAQEGEQGNGEMKQEAEKRLTVTKQRLGESKEAAWREAALHAGG